LVHLLSSNSRKKSSLTPTSPWVFGSPVFGPKKNAPKNTPAERAAPTLELNSDDDDEIVPRLKQSNSCSLSESSVGEEATPAAKTTFKNADSPAMADNDDGKLFPDDDDAELFLDVDGDSDSDGAIKKKNGRRRKERRKRRN
jgi:hypothetical protein